MVQATTTRFVNLTTALGVSHTLASSTAEAIAEAYSEPQRSYHTLSHISHMLEGLDQFPQRFSDRVAVELAVWFHDVVYDPVRGAPWNEEESIRVWENFVEAAKPSLVSLSTARAAIFRELIPSQDHLRTAVSALIHSTISHQLPASSPPSLATLDISAFLNLDIAILASPSAAYRIYSDAIRFEYIHIPLDGYRSGRAKVLGGFLNREKLFFGEGNDEEEAQARANLSDEISGLESGRLPEP